MTEPAVKSNKKRHILLTSLSISVGIHLAALFIFYKHPLILHSRLGFLFPTSKKAPIFVPQEELSSMEKDKWLEETFNDWMAPSSPFQKPYDIEIPLKFSTVAPSKEKAETLPYHASEVTLKEVASPSFAISEKNTPQEKWIAKPPPLADTPSFEKQNSLSQEELFSVPLFEIGEKLVSLSSPTSLKNAPSPENSPEEVLLLKPSDLLTEKIPPPLSETTLQDPIASLPKAPLGNPARSAPSSPLLKSEDSLSQADLARLSSLPDSKEIEDKLTINMQLLPLDEENKYFFSLSFVPVLDANLEKIPQHFDFLIDRSSSIEKHRFATFKKAVIKALAYLQEGDTFNIRLIDKKTTALSPTPLSFNKASLHKAEVFLDKQEHAGYFATADIYTSLNQILPSEDVKDKLFTAILLTDGATLLPQKKNKTLLNQWIEKNNGRVALYTAAIGQDNHLPIMQLFSALNGGKLLYSDTHASFPRKLGKLLLDLRRPLAQDLLITTSPLHKHTKIVLHPNTTHHPAFYDKQPYIIYGTIDKLEDFTLSIQARSGEKYLAIEQAISFQTAKENQKDLSKKWALQQAFVAYQSFLQEGNMEHLKKVKELLKPFGGELACE